MSRMLKFPVVSASSTPAEVLVDLNSIETVVDGSAFGHLDVTQVTMISGNKFYIKKPYGEVLQLLSQFKEVI